MTILVALNGQIASEGAAFYALKFAATLGRAVELIHVENDEDALEEVEASMADVEAVAAQYGVDVRRRFLEGNPVRAVREYLKEHLPDILFCGTRVRGRPLRDSFSQRLASLHPDCDLAVVRTVHAGAALAVERALLPIRAERMPGERYAFFAILLRGYGASGEIYSVTRLMARKRVELEIEQVRERLEDIDRCLAHYTRLAALADLRVYVKHAFAGDETTQILHHLHHHGYQLLVLGGRRSRFPYLMPDRTERLLQATPVNTILFYSRGGRPCSCSR